MKSHTKEAIDRCAATLGIQKLRPIQKDAIRSILKGDDTMVLLGTSGGKSAIFQIPAMMLEGLTIVITPLISLMENQVAALRDHGIAAACLHSNACNQPETLKQASAGELSLLYLSPERLLLESRCHPTLIACASLIVLDECHCALQWGSSFRKAYLEVVDHLAAMHNRPPIFMCSATLTTQDCDALLQRLDVRNCAIFRGSLERKNLKLSVYRVSHDADRYQRLRNLLSQRGEKGCSVVYCTTISQVEDVYDYLLEDCGFARESIARCHSQLDNRQEEEAHFLHGDARIMIATSAFGMGINVPDIRLVVLMGLPFSIASYTQQVGRAGRDGKSSTGVLLFHPDDLNRNLAILRYDLAGQQAASEMLDYAQGEGCLQQRLLGYFNQSCAPCGVCSGCKGGKTNG